MPSVVAAAAAAAASLFIGIKSAPGNFERRSAWRNSSCAASYARAGYPYKFFVGRPLSQNHALTAHRQGQHDTAEEQLVSSRLAAEAADHNDIEFLLMRDQYMDLSNKLLAIFRFGLRHSNASYIVEQDDEYCLHTRTAARVIERHRLVTKASQELYAGVLQWKGDEYDIMRGPHGEVAPFMSGSCSILSRELVRTIMRDDWLHTYFSSLYGTTSDDANTGKWIQHAQAAHNVSVDFVSAPALRVEV